MKFKKSHFKKFVFDLSRLQEVDLVFPIFFSHFLFFSIHFTVFPFLELGLGLE